MTIETQEIQVTNTESLTPADIKDALRRFIMDELLTGRGAAIGDDEELLLSGLVDSLGAVRMISFIESELKVRVPPEDVVIEHFQTINAMAAYLSQRIGMK